MSTRPLHTLQLPPATLAALIRAGYETFGDVTASTPEELARDVRISLLSSQAIFSATQRSGAPTLTQSVAEMTGASMRKYASGSFAMDEILEGGLKRGTILEISGPPGVATQTFAINFAKQFIKDGQRVIFADMHNSITAAQLLELVQADDDTPLPHGYRSLLLHTSLFTFSEFLLFLYKLPSYLRSHNTTGLLVLNSFSLAFHSLPTNISHASRAVLHEKIRQMLAQACGTAGLTIVVTAQLSTKLLSTDGSLANFDTGDRAIMVPQPGNAYIPQGWSYRLMIVPHSQDTGTIQLIASPSHTYRIGQPPIREVPYELVRGTMQ